MGLTDDQRAMLRLLAQNDDSYEDLAALKGVSVEQVRAEVREALAAAAEEQAPAQPTPAPAEPAKPAEPSLEPKPAAKPKKAKPRMPRAPIPADRRRLLLWAGGAIVVVAIVLGAIAIAGGTSGESGSPPAPSGGNATSAENASTNNPKLTQAKLKPVAGGEGEGQAVFGRLKKKIVMLVEAVGLEPSKQGESYAIWLYKSPKLAIRVASVEVSKSGGLRVPVQLTREVFAAVLARVFDKINVTRIDDAAYEAEVARAKKQNKLPRYSGETVLSGEVTGPVLKKNPSG